jgi:hypothetical protein
MDNFAEQGENDFWNYWSIVFWNSIEFFMSVTGDPPNIPKRCILKNRYGFFFWDIGP